MLLTKLNYLFSGNISYNCLIYFRHHYKKKIKESQVFFLSTNWQLISRVSSSSYPFLDIYEYNLNKNNLYFLIKKQELGKFPLSYQTLLLLLLYEMP